MSIHRISPGTSWTRWHPCGEHLSKEVGGICFVALDWHLIDCSDTLQDKFLTMLPKHFWMGPSLVLVDELLKDCELPKTASKIRASLEWINGENCPRSMEDAAEVLCAVIEQGLGWGTANKPFIPCIKSWSGGGVSANAGHGKSRKRWTVQEEC